MQKFTVVLLRPDYLASDDAGGYGQDVYVALVQASNEIAAAASGQAEVFTADTADQLEPNDPEDYAPVLVLAGHHVPVLWGWQL
jgi:hypothetical protein